MGRKRRLPARAREKLVGEEVATAMEVEQQQSVLQAKPDDALFVVDAVGKRELETEERRPFVAGRPLVSTTSLCCVWVCCVVFNTMVFNSILGDDATAGALLVAGSL